MIDGVADADVAALAQFLAIAADALDVVLIVQRDVLHDDAADTDRLELADRGQRAGAADLDFDILEHGDGALGRKLVRDRPARRARDETEPFLPVEAIDLVDHAVDVVIEMRAPRFDVTVEGEQRVDRLADFGERIGLEAASLEPFDHAGLAIGRHLAHLPPAIGEKAERPRRRDARVFLAQRAGGGIARVGEDGVARRFLAFVELEEVRLGHVDLAAHLAHRRHAPALEAVRHFLQRLDIGGDVLALGAVATRGGANELAILIAQRHRQAVDLRLGAERDLLVVGQAQEAADAADKIDDVVFGERVVERQHRHRVPDLGETPGRRRADPLRQALQRAQLRKARFDGIVAPPQRVIFGVGDARRVVLIVAPVVPGDLGREPRVFGLGLFLSEIVDG